MAAEWKVDEKHSVVGFSARHMMITRVRGHFSKWSAQVKMGDGLDQSSVEASIEAASIQTPEPDRDTHLRSADFLEVEKYPRLTFRSRKLEGTPERFRLTGDLTIKDVTREVTLDVERTGTGKDPWGGERQAFSAKTRIDRKDFGLTYNKVLETGGFLVSDQVEIEIEVSLVKQS